MCVDDVTNQEAVKEQRETIQSGVKPMANQGIQGRKKANLCEQ